MKLWRDVEDFASSVHPSVRQNNLDGQVRFCSSTRTVPSNLEFLIPWISSVSFGIGFCCYDPTSTQLSADSIAFMKSTAEEFELANKMEGNKMKNGMKSTKICWLKNNGFNFGSITVLKD